MDKNDKNRGKLFFLADAWMVPLALFAMLYFAVRGETVLAVVMAVVLIGAVAKLYRWGKDRKK